MSFANFIKFCRKKTIEDRELRFGMFSRACAAVSDVGGYAEAGFGGAGAADLGFKTNRCVRECSRAELHISDA